MRVDIVHLRYVVAAAGHRSFRRAAAALNISQPTLSKRIRELETRVGMLLFERSTGGAQLTANGEDFLLVAKRVLADLDGLASYAKATKTGNAGRLHIGFYTVLAGPLRDTVFSFIRQHPQLDLNLIEDDRVALITFLDRGTIDIAIVLGEPVYRDYAHMSLWSERIMVALHKTHRLAGSDFVYWTDLKGERFLMSLYDPGPEIKDVLLGKLALPGDRPFIKHVQAHHSAMISAVDGDRGITLACESSSVPPWPNVVFREVRDGNGPTRLGFVAYWRRNNGNPTLKQFLTWLQAHPTVPPAPTSATD
jgi:DNA-binding transcriptional LysR family regulator